MTYKPTSGSTGWEKCECLRQGHGTDTRIPGLFSYLKGEYTDTPVVGVYTVFLIKSMTERVAATVLISASFSSGCQNHHCVQGEEHPHPRPIPTVGRHPGMLYHLLTVGKVI